MRDLIERFYARAWNLWDGGAVTSLLDKRFVFRGSLGDEATGRDGFRGYRDKVRAAFPDFHNEILDLVIEGDRAAACLRYTGHHRGTSSDSRPPTPSRPITGRRSSRPRTAAWPKRGFSAT